jgi:hypothetical protein
LTKPKNIKLKYKEYLSGKKVVLVGPAWHTKNTRQEDLIESYDIVVRINLGFIMSKKRQLDIGRRTDVLYSSLANYFFNRKIFSKNNVKNAGIKWIIGTGHHRSGFLNSTFTKIKKDINILMVDKEVFENIVSIVNTRKKITSGMVTIFDLLQYDISELYITGFTFYNIFFAEKKKKYYYGGYMENYLRKASTAFYAHDNEKEFRVLKNICKKDKRIKCDNILKKIFKDNK